MEWIRKSGYHWVSDSPRGYTICVTGPKDSHVYTAWGPGKWHAWNYQPIEDFRDGADKDKATAAKQACIKHFMEATKNGSNGRAA